jgi:hypothetical protein
MPPAGTGACNRMRASEPASFDVQFYAPLVREKSERKLESVEAKERALRRQVRRGAGQHFPRHLSFALKMMWRSRAALRKRQLDKH